MVTKNIKHKGFTIVELLIVIVVIGILAAITIVSYSGISARATASQNLANANSVLKAAEAVRSDTSIATVGGYYPNFDNTTPATQIGYLNAGSAKVPSGLSVTGKAQATALGTVPTATNNAILYVINGASYTAATGICIYYFDTTPGVANPIKALTSGAATAASAQAAGVAASALTCT